jgi:hypothetical protein
VGVEVRERGGGGGGGGGGRNWRRGLRAGMREKQKKIVGPTFGGGKWRASKNGG